MQKIIRKDKLAGFVEGLMRDYDVVAPVKDGNTKFRKINSFDEFYLSGACTDIPVKSHFMPDGETLVEIKNGKAIELKSSIRPTILFGLRKCDLNAIEIMDEVMFDQQYMSRRENTILVGFFCEEPDEYCFCNSMELDGGGYDLFFYLRDDYYYIDVGSKKGEALVKDLYKVKAEISIPNPKNKKKLKRKNIEGVYRSAIWEKDVKKCLSCSACTAYCPTCNCFDIRDEFSIDMKNGKRTRYFSSCMLKGFSKVAGGKSYRDSRLSRFKHFVYHKIVYFKKQKGRPMCVGCGRCLRVCPTKIDWVDTINNMKVKKKTKTKKKVNKR